MNAEPLQKMRLDKWLWAARFYKTRALANAEVEKNRVKVNQQEAKPAREVHIGDVIHMRQGSGLNQVDVTVTVVALSQIRGPAMQARMLYQESAESLKMRELARERRRMMNEPALAIEKGRPTKRDRRKLSEWQRWSAVADSSNE